MRQTRKWQELITTTTSRAGEKRTTKNGTKVLSVFHETFGSIGQLIFIWFLAVGIIFHFKSKSYHVERLPSAAQESGRDRTWRVTRIGPLRQNPQAQKVLLLPLLLFRRRHVDLLGLGHSVRIGHQRRPAHPAHRSGPIQLALEALDAALGY